MWFTGAKWTMVLTMAVTILGITYAEVWFNIILARNEICNRFSEGSFVMVHAGDSDPR